MELQITKFTGKKAVHKKTFSKVAGKEIIVKKTHCSLYDFIGYLIPGGLAVLPAPQLALKSMCSSGQYGNVLARLVGMLMVAPGIFVMQACAFWQRSLLVGSNS